MLARRRDRFPEVLRGTGLVHHRRYGKANCRCASGEELHELTLLSYREGGKAKHLMLAAAEVEPARGDRAFHGSGGSAESRGEA